MEAGGQQIRGFRHGLDYAFIREIRGCGACYPARAFAGRHPILVSAPGAYALGGSMSLYRAGLKLALFLPLGVAMPPRKGRRQVSPM